MKSIKFVLYFLKNLITRNVVKILFITFGLVSFLYAGTFEPTKYEIDVIKKIDFDTTKSHLYLYSTVENNNVKYQVLQSNTPLTLVNNKYIYYRYNRFNVFLWAVFLICLIAIVISTIIGMRGDGVAWDIDESYIYAMSKFLTCEEKNGKYYYILFDRLVFVSDSLLNKSYRSCSTSESIIRNIRISSFTDLKAYPKFKTKIQKKDSLLSKEFNFLTLLYHH